MHSDHSFWLPLLTGGTFLLAGGVRGVLGMGLPTLAMGLLGLVMPPAQAAALLGLALQRRWLLRQPGSRALQRTPAGRSALAPRSAQAQQRPAA